MHKSFILPIAFFFSSKFIRDSRYLIGIWFLCLFLSFIMGTYLQDMLGNYFSEYQDRRLTEYLTKKNENYNQGFRIDFILYSFIPVIVGYIYIVKNKFNEQFYYKAYCMYVLSNAFWLIVIRANFSDRFAFLSWFTCSLRLE